jgi:predicted RecA/RadA family phage recombinase
MNLAVATFSHGDPVMVDYTPATAVDAGDIILFNSVPVIAHKDIAANTLGAVAISNGVYDIEKTAGEALVRGAAVYYNDDTEKATREATSNFLLGIAVEFAGSAATTVKVYHQPEGAESSSE